MKLFVASDIHGFYTEFKSALENAGFEAENENHLLIICGDLFDRGKEAVRLYKWLNTIRNKILIRGNHEDLMLEMINRSYPQQHDISNGTYNTAKQFAYDNTIYEIDWNKLHAIFSRLVESTVNYFETSRYIFVHGWIPVTVKDNLPNHYTRNRDFEFNPEWRTKGDWKSARWVSPIEMYKLGFTVPNKTIVCGHWHTSAAHCLLHNDGTEWGPDANFTPFYDDGIIMLDACTAYTKKVNVIVLEDDLID